MKHWRGRQGPEPGGLGNGKVLGFCAEGQGQPEKKVEKRNN